MKATPQFLQARRSAFLLISTVTLLLASTASAQTHLLLKRGAQVNHPAEYTGIVDLVIDPGFDSAKVTVVVDGQTVATNLLSPWRLKVDLGSLPVQHTIAIKAVTPKGKRVQWTETINRGNLPLKVTLRPLDGRTFEAQTTSPQDDPIEVVELWHGGQVVSSFAEGSVPL